MGSPNERVKRYLTFATGLFECIGFTGVIFGWASLVFVLKKGGYFSELCIPLNNTSDPGMRNGTMDCDLQDERFALIFTVASFMNSFMILPSGFLFDYLGTRITRLLAILLFTTATLMIAFSTAASVALLFSAACMIAVGGSILSTTNVQVGNLFRNNRSTVITLYHGAFGSSAAVFLLIKVLYEACLSLKFMFLLFSCLSSILILRTYLLLPRTHIPYPLPEGYTYGIYSEECRLKSFSHGELTARQRKLLQGRDGMERGEDERQEETEGNRRETQDEMETERGMEHKAIEVIDGVNSQSKGPEDSEANNEDIPSFISCISSKLFLTHLLWLSIIQLRNFLFIGTLNPMLTMLANGDSKQVSRFTNAFAFIQLCGVFCAPWNGLIMDWHKHKDTASAIVSASATSQRQTNMKPVVLSLAITVTQAVLFSICITIPILQVQYLTFILQVITRAFLYGGDATFITMMFPPCHFGKIYGLAQALSAVIALLQYPCFALVQGPLQDDPLYMNIGFIVLVMLAYAHPINVYLHCRRETGQ